MGWRLGFLFSGLDFSLFFFGRLLLFLGLVLLGFFFFLWLFNECHDDQEVIFFDSDVGEDIGIVGSLAFEDNLL